MHANCIELIPTNVSTWPDGFDLIGPVRSSTRNSVLDRFRSDLHLQRHANHSRNVFGGRNISHSHCSRLAVGIALDWVWEFESSVMLNHLGRGPKQFGNWQPWQKFPRYCVLQFASGASEEKGKCIGYSTIVFV